MRKYFFTGFITLLPIALTVIIAGWLFDLFTAPLAGMAESVILAYEKKWNLRLDQHTTLVIFLSRILAFVLLTALIFLLGFLGRRFFMSFLLRLTDRLLSHIPFVRTIYRLTNEVTKAVFSDSKKTFKETVLVPFPHHDARAIGFVTGDSPSVFKEKTQTDLAIFVPTSPHPMSGFVLLTPKKIVLPVDVSVEEAFKFIISCGVIHPGEHAPSEASPPGKPT
jgi:uncharacterized membrane protein